MRKNNCEEIRRELDELMVDEAHSASAVAHLKECSDCREFHQTQMKLRRMVGSLGTVAAPPDFDFRLRARLANDAGGAGLHYWSFARKGLAFATVLIVFAAGMIVVRNVMDQQIEPRQIAKSNTPVQQESPQPVPSTSPTTSASPDRLMTGVQQSSPQRIRLDRSVHTGPKIKRPLSTVDRAGTGAGVISGSEAVSAGTTAVIPIDASLPTLKFSLDDGSGNPRTISVPTIRFGSQRMLPNGNQFAPKGNW